jgi:hypothetical protein
MSFSRFGVRKAFGSRYCKHGFPKPISPQSVVVVARVQVRLHLQEAAVEGLRLVTERDGLRLALAGNGDILYSLTWNDRTGHRVDDMVIVVVVVVVVVVHLM